MRSVLITTNYEFYGAVCKDCSWHTKGFEPRSPGHISALEASSWAADHALNENHTVVATARIEKIVAPRKKEEKGQISS